jgi:hypothetical protein
MDSVLLLFVKFFFCFGAERFMFKPQPTVITTLGRTTRQCVNQQMKMFTDLVSSSTLL